MPLVSFINGLLLRGKVRQETLKIILLFSALSLMKDYVLLLYRQVISTQEGLKGSAKILYVRHQTAARDMPSIIHSVTVYKCRNPQAFSNLVQLATFRLLTFYKMVIMISGKQDWAKFERTHVGIMNVDRCICIIIIIYVLWLLSTVYFDKGYECRQSKRSRPISHDFLKFWY